MSRAKAEKTNMLGLRERMEENGSAPGTGEALKRGSSCGPGGSTDRPLRRRFSPAYKLRTRKSGPGPSPARWVNSCGERACIAPDVAQAAHSGSLKALSKKRGRKPERNPLDEKVRKLERRNARLENAFRKAHLIIDVQRKVAGLLGISLDDGTNS